MFKSGREIVLRFAFLKNIIFIRELVPAMTVKAVRSDFIISKEAEYKPLGVIMCIFPKKNRGCPGAVWKYTFSGWILLLCCKPRIRGNHQEGVLQLQQAGLSSLIGQECNVRSREHPKVPFPYLSHGNIAKCEAFTSCYYGKKHWYLFQEQCIQTFIPGWGRGFVC